MTPRLVQVQFASVALVFAMSATAAAQPSASQVQEAERLFTEATQHYEDGSFALAAQGFERSYELMQGHERQALILFNVGQSYARLGRNREARDRLQRYLRDAGDQAPNRAQAEAILRELETRVNIEGSSAPRGTSISPIGPIVLGIGGAAVIAGAILGGVALSQADDLSPMCPSDNCPESLRSEVEDAVLLANVTDGLWIGGAVVAAVGLVLTFTLTESDSSEVAIGCDPAGCRAGWRASF